MTRELAFTSENAGGSSRGTTAQRTTPYAFEDTSTPSAAGYSSRPPVLHRPRHRQREQRPGEHRAAIAARRPCGSRSSSGPTTGASSANGAIVTSEIQRYAAARLIRRDGEEDRGGERDGDQHVAGGVHRVQLDQFAEAGLARAVRVRAFEPRAGSDGQSRGVAVARHARLRATRA